MNVIEFYRLITSNFIENFVNNLSFKIKDSFIVYSILDRSDFFDEFESNLADELYFQIKAELSSIYSCSDIGGTFIYFY
jgi:hypothetical protein